VTLSSTENRSQPSGSQQPNDPASGCACPVCGAPIAADRVIVDPQRRWLVFRGVMLELSPMEAEIAAMLVTGASVDSLMAAAWAGGGTTREVVNAVVGRLRRKAAVVGLDVESIGYGQGWRLTASAD
jgi:DNA-binding response OmpR family regulator